MATIVIMLDAFRKDYITKENTPFLYSIASKGSFGELTQPPGFKNAFGFFTGKMPAKAGQFVNYGYDKNERMGFPFIFKFLPRKFAFNAFNLWNYIKGNDMFYPAMDLKYAKYFTIIQKKHFYHRNSVPMKTLFDYFRENNIKFLFYDFPLIITNRKEKIQLSLNNSDKNRTDRFLKLAKKDYEFYYLH